jgi:hypothetical protein
MNTLVDRERHCSNSSRIRTFFKRTCSKGTTAGKQAIMHEVVRRRPCCIPPNTILVSTSSPFFCRHALGSHRLFGMDCCCCCCCCFCCCLYHGNSLTIRNSHAFADGRPIIIASCRDVEFRRRACPMSEDRPICLGEEFGLESHDQGDNDHCADPGFHPSRWSDLAVLIGLNLSHIATSLPVVIRCC